ncbi:hypothetical protein [Azohydromonas aeria]|uniref:hypothetical protein n=1 Tax=Azohydromonas aeria TaxID=2590212 RepID=UPI0012F9EC03|nr:hypothetical protein [Azohydromonas aeria]
MIDVYRRRIAAMVVRLAREDPELVKEVIARLRRDREIESDDLVYLERIADDWIRVTADNRRSARH